MRKVLPAFLLSGGACLAIAAGSSDALAAGASVPRGAIGVSENAMVRVDYYRRRYHVRCCGPRYYHRRPVYGYYAPPPVYYVPPVVYYPPPVIYYPPPVVYGGYAAVAPYRYYAPRVRYYRDYDW